MKKYYYLKLNKNQLYVLKSALEVFARMHTGQWSTVFDEVFRFKYKNIYKKMNEIFDDFVKQYLEHTNTQYCKGTLYRVLDACKKKILNLNLNEGLGIFCKEVNNDARTAWDIMQVVRTKLGDPRQPFRSDKKNPLPQIK